MYIAVSDSAISSVMVTEREKDKKPIFYYSKKLHAGGRKYELYTHYYKSFTNQIFQEK